MDEENMQQPPELPEPEGPGGPGGHGGAGSPPIIGGIPGGRPAGETLTGDERVDEAVAGLSRLPGRPADEHVAVLEEVHGRLRDILGELNEGPGLTDQAESP
jgi:hypothetical protein